MPSQTQIRRFARGTVIIRQNEPADGAYIVLSGRVAVYKEAGRRRETLAILGRGEVFGEMALVLEKPQPAGVVALEDTVARHVPAEVFCRLISGGPSPLAPLMRALFERLRTMDSKPALALARPAAAQADARSAVEPGFSVNLVGMTAEAEEALACDGGVLRITTFPFRIGRKAGGGLLRSILTHNDLSIPDSEPFQVSRNHCAINRIAGGSRFFVADRGSSLGTILNGRCLGGTLEACQAECLPGRNELILGGKESPYRFQFVIEPAPEA